MELLPCPRCGCVPFLTIGGAWTVTCLECYCGAPDSATRNDIGQHPRKEKAIAEWNAFVESFEE